MASPGERTTEMAGLTEETTKLCYITPAFVDTGWDLEHISCEDVWFYRMDMPEGYKHFSETKPIQLAHFEPVVDWRENRSEIEVDGNPKAKRFTAQELKDLQYNFDQCGFPHDEEGGLRGWWVAHCQGLQQ